MMTYEIQRISPSEWISISPALHVSWLVYLLCYYHHYIVYINILFHVLFRHCGGSSQGKPLLYVCIDWYLHIYGMSPLPQNYGISSQIIFGQLGVWQSSNGNWKHICSKMYLSINYVDINIYPLTMECNAPLSMFIWKGRNIKWQYYYYYYFQNNTCIYESCLL